MSEKLTLKNGTELTGFAISSDFLFLYIYSSDLRTVFDLLIDPANTAEIIYTMNNGEDVKYEGFTKLISVRDEGDYLITAVLKKGA